MCKKERETCEFEMILRNLFCVLVWLILCISLYFLYNTNISGQMSGQISDQWQRLAFLLAFLFK